MKTPFLSLTTGGILSILLGLIFLAISSHRSGKNDEFLKHGLLREGRVVSQEERPDSSKFILRLITNVSPKVTGADMQIIPVEVKEADFKELTVGSLRKLILIPGDPPRARLAGSTTRRNHRFGYVLSSFCICLGILLLWLEWRHHHPAPRPFVKAHVPKDRKEAAKLPALALLSDIMEKQALRNPILYQGPFEFSYSSEKTVIELKDGTNVRISQYRPITQLPQVLADKDLLHVLRSAQSDWELVDTITTGQLALSHLLKEKHASSADQFFINGAYLGLLHRDETENGQWHAFVRGIWKITPLSRTFAKLTSGDPRLARQAAFEILNHSDLSLIATLAPGLPEIRNALKRTPRTGKIADDRRFITRAADIIHSLAKGNCYCPVYAKSSDPAHIAIKKGKFTLSAGKKGDKKTEVTCTHCQKKYLLHEHAGSYVPYYVWDEKKEPHSTTPEVHSPTSTA